MGKKSTPTPPAAPDPGVIIQAQANASTNAADLQALLNNVNYRGPEGNISFNQETPGSPQYTKNVQLSPAEQQIFDLSNQGQIGALQAANGQVGRVNQALAGGFNDQGLPALATSNPDVGNIISTPSYGSQKSTFDASLPVQGQIGPTDFSADRQAVTDSVWNEARSRLDPMWDQGEDRLHTRLSNQGFSDNSQGSTNAYGDFGRAKNDAYNGALYGAIQQGAAEQGQLFGEAAQKGQFANSAAAQDYAQNQGRAQFLNDATNQDYQNKLAYTDVNNRAQQQAFNEYQANNTATNQTRQQGLSERAYASQLPINQLSALLGLGQVNMPEGVPFAPTQVQAPDAVGAYGVATNAATQRYQAQMAAAQAARSDLFGGLAKLGSAGITAISDRRLKRDIRPVGWLKGLRTYVFRYLWSDAWQYGVMAQEALHVRPDIVRVHPAGFLMVDYGAI